MRYYYGTSDSYHQGGMSKATPQELSEIIRDDVESGKWNRYYGGQIHNIDATCSYRRPGFIYHGRLFIFGTKEEFKELEKLIKPFIEHFTPRCYSEDYRDCE